MATSKCLIFENFMHRTPETQTLHRTIHPRLQCLSPVSELAHSHQFDLNQLWYELEVSQMRLSR